MGSQQLRKTEILRPRVRPGAKKPSPSGLEAAAREESPGLRFIPSLTRGSSCWQQRRGGSLATGFSFGASLAVADLTQSRQGHPDSQGPRCLVFLVLAAHVAATAQDSSGSRSLNHSCLASKNSSHPLGSTTVLRPPFGFLCRPL